MSAAEPQFKPAPQTHRLEEPAKTVFAVVCWYCGSRGPLSDSPRQAVARWQHDAHRQGAPRW